MDGEVMLAVDRIGVMQGRLLPPIDGRIQAFPANRWPEEFQTARQVGFAAIEFIFDGDPGAHPLLRRSGIDEIRSAMARTGVVVDAMCADYFMAHPFHGVSPRETDQSLRHLRALLDAAGALGIQTIVIPCVDASTLETGTDRTGLVTALHEAAGTARAAGVTIALETDLDPHAFGSFLDLVPGDIGVNYDMGNSASLGFDPPEEFAAYGRRIASVHVKDRRHRGSTVPLGTGDADLALCFRLLEEMQYRGPLTIQGARGEDDVATARQYLEFVRRFVSAGVAERWISD